MTLAGTLRQAPARIRRLWREAVEDAKVHFQGYRALRDGLSRHAIQSLSGLDVLDVGCGDRAQLSLLCAADGARVVGFDVSPVALGMDRPRMWFAVARSQGLIPAARVVVRDFLHTFRYWRCLERQSGQRLPFRDVRLVRGDAAALPFPDASFDLVVSSAVWEHLNDVGRATQEVNRVLRPGGVAFIQIALFPALQGGHHAEWHSTEVSSARATRPWDHLYPDRKPLPTYLNEWREDQFREVFERCLDVVEWQDGEMRGSAFLTDEISAELAQFTRRELLLSSLSAWARRRGPGEPLRRERRL